MSEEMEIKPDDNIAISVKNLCKTYHLNKFDPVSFLKSKTTKNHADSFQEFEALKDVSFNLMNGHVAGIIGSNGSGKTTLLRILSEITKPSSGQAIINGTVTSILDIGSNFHPDLTGYENTLMQLRTRGVSKRYYEDLVKQIRQFSGINEFFQQPVKFYSNGMFLRLAFSVVFNIPSDILILDEVLSVGDEEFRLKSYALMKEFKYSGKTILFVSHSRNEILELCDQCIWLDRGRLRKAGVPKEILGEYFEMQRGNYEAELNTEKGNIPQTSTNQDLNEGIDITWSGTQSPGNNFFTVKEVSITQGGQYNRLLTSKEIDISITIEKKKAGGSISVLLIVNDVFYQPVLIAHLLNNSSQQNFVDAFKNETGLLEMKCTIPGNFMAAGVYYMQIRFGVGAEAGEKNSPNDYHLQDNLKFRLRPNPEDFDFIGNSINGSARPAFNWTYVKR
jgi:ABC-type polysaccharide/polyol phosphate transport system ATPase subunit